MLGVTVDRRESHRSGSAVRTGGTETPAGRLLTWIVRTVRRVRATRKEPDMSQQDRYIAGVPCWIDTSQPDPGAAVAFYGDLFGWEFEDVMPPDSPLRYFVARMPGADVAAVGSSPEGAPMPAAWRTDVWVTDADETAGKVRAAGGRVLAEPRDVPGHGRRAVFADPAGAAFCAWQAGEHRGAAVVNEPGSVNFNDLHTRDVDGARAFYGAVFGWETSTWAAASPGRCPATATSSSSAGPGCARAWPRSARRRGSRTSSPPSSRSPTTSPTCRRTGASRSPSTTPTPSPPERPSSAARSSSLRSTRRGCA